MIHIYIHVCLISPLRIVVRRLRFTAAFRAVERAATRAGYQVSDTLLAVVVEARQYPGLLEMLLANGTCQFVVQFLKTHGEQVIAALRHLCYREWLKQLVVGGGGGRGA